MYSSNSHKGHILLHQDVYRRSLPQWIIDFRRISSSRPSTTIANKVVHESTSPTHNHTHAVDDVSKPQWLLDMLIAASYPPAELEGGGGDNGLVVVTHDLEPPTEVWQPTTQSENIKSILDNTETLILSVPVVYWIIFMCGTAVLLIAVASCLMYARYRKKRIYAMVDTRRETLIPAKSSISRSSFLNVSQNNALKRIADRMGRYGGGYAKLIPLEEISVPKQRRKGRSQIYLSSKDHLPDVYSSLSVPPENIPLQAQEQTAATTGCIRCTHATGCVHTCTSPVCTCGSTQSAESCHQNRNKCKNKYTLDRCGSSHTASIESSDSVSDRHSCLKASRERERQSKADRRKDTKASSNSNRRNSQPRQHRTSKRRADGEYIPLRFRLPTTDHSSLTSTYHDH